jgi:phospholipid/cholesterol/gamma-HCH transport system substrate-binding protein
MLTKDPKMAAKLSDTIGKLDDMLTQIDSGQGSLGALLKDRQLYDHADKVMTDTSDLIVAIRKDPKKYLTFHVKIF